MVSTTQKLLEPDYAGAVFKLLFAFSNDEAIPDSDISNPSWRDFNSELEEILLGTRVSKAICKRLESVFYSAVQTEESIENLALAAKKVLTKDHGSLITTVLILLRLSITDGIVCRQSAARFQAVVSVFELTPDSLLGLPEELHPYLELILEQAYFQQTVSKSKQLTSLYQTLECPPDCTDGELRSAYRKLVKKFHPDSSSDALAHQTSARAFQEVKTAFEEISKVREQL